jgi:hypothetical protein
MGTGDGLATGSFRPPDPPGSCRGFEREKSATQLNEKARREQPVGDGTVVAITHAAKIRPGPFEYIALGEDDPRTLAIKVKMAPGPTHEISPAWPG